MFESSSQRCECYQKNDGDIVQCNGTNAEIKQGYWFGNVLGNVTIVNLLVIVQIWEMDIIAC